MQERMGRARRMIWYCWLWVAFCSARVWMSFSCSDQTVVSHPHVCVNATFTRRSASIPSSSKTSGVLPLELSSVG